MSTYNLMNGYQPAVFFMLPMLIDEHPDKVIPRFRDCFIGRMTRAEDVDEYGIPKRKLNDDEVISIFTRTGGDNRDTHIIENLELKMIPGYIENYDDSFDDTFALWVYEVPKEFKVDFIYIREGMIAQTSIAYKERVYKVWPKLKDKFDKLFQ